MVTMGWDGMGIYGRTGARECFSCIPIYIHTMYSLDQRKSYILHNDSMTHTCTYLITWSYSADKGVEFDHCVF